MRRLDSRPPTIFLTSLLLTIELFAAVGCRSSGRELRPPDPSAVAPARRTSTTSKATSSTALGLNLSSPVLEPSGRLPNEYTCEGAGLSPPLTWTGVPPEAVSLVLLVLDQDAEGAVQWLVLDIPPSVGATTKGIPPSGGVEASNSFGSTGWKAPCSEAVHSYEFYLLAFDVPPNVEGITDPKQVATALQQSADGAATFTAKYGKTSGRAGTT